ncbi:MAG: TlpA disulfide reductase family protein [Pigmentiphaga sp.]
MANEYNTPHPLSWSRSWQNDPLGGGLSDEWSTMIESFRSKTPLGVLAPTLQGQTLEGESFDLASYRNKKSVLVVFGSLACPPCVTNIRTTQPSLVSLYEQYNEAVEFCYVYTREAHPGSHIVPHASMEDKRRNAAILRKQEPFDFPLVLDSLEGEIQNRWADIQFNNPVYLVNRAGVVVYKSAWLDASELPQVLDDVALWDAKSPTEKTIKKTFSERIRPLREPFDPTANARIKRLMDYIGLDQRAMGPIPGVEADRVQRDEEGQS